MDAVPCGVMTLDSEKSLLSATLVPSFKYTLEPFSVTWFVLTCKQPCNALPLYVFHVVDRQCPVLARQCRKKNTFVCISQLENWQAVLIEAGKRAYPGRNPDTVIFLRVHSAIEEVSSLTLRNKSVHEQLYSLSSLPRYEFFGACYWTQVTQVWDIFDLCGGEKGWVIHHNNQRLRHHKVSVNHGDFFAYERSDSNTPFQADLSETDLAQESVQNLPTPLHGEAAGSTAPAPSVAEAVGTTQNAGSPTFEQTGDPLLLIGRDSSQWRQRDRQVFFDMRSFQ